MELNEASKTRSLALALLNEIMKILRPVDLYVSDQQPEHHARQRIRSAESGKP